MATKKTETDITALVEKVCEYAEKMEDTQGSEYYRMGYKFGEKFMKEKINPLFAQLVADMKSHKLNENESVLDGLWDGIMSENKYM
jgi:hypothetical protein